MSINAGLIGFGNWGTNLARNLDELGEYNLVSISDEDEERQKMALGEYDVRSDMNSELDIVFIATPPTTHYSIANEFLQRGVNIFLEKPAVTSVKCCDELLYRAVRNNASVFVDHTFIYNDSVNRMKDLIQSEMNENWGVRLTLERMSSGTYQQDVGILRDITVHDLAVVDYLLEGRRPAKVKSDWYSFAANNQGSRIDYELFFNISDRAPVSARITNSWDYPEKRREIMASVGVKGSYRSKYGKKLDVVIDGESKVLDVSTDKIQEPLARELKWCAARLNHKPGYDLEDLRRSRRILETIERIEDD